MTLQPAVAMDGDLVKLRSAAANSFAWRKGGFSGGRRLTLEQYDALPDDQRKGWRWMPDRNLVDKLVEAERAHTQRFGQC